MNKFENLLFKFVFLPACSSTDWRECMILLTQTLVHYLEEASDPLMNAKRAEMGVCIEGLVMKLMR